MLIDAHLIKSWGLRTLSPLTQTNWATIWRGWSNRYSHECVIKVHTNREAAAAEAGALKRYDGHGAARLYAYDEQKSALLLERIIPGSSLRAYFPDRDDEAAYHAADILKALHGVPISPQNSMPTVESLLTSLQQSPSEYAHEAWLFGKKLCASAEYSVLLHGDLHHDNILLCESRGWLAIDPKGIIGDPAYDCAAFLRNPIVELSTIKNLDTRIRRRCEIFSQSLAIPIDRIYGWGFVGAVLAAHWAHEDGEDTKKWLAVATVFKNSHSF